MTALQKVITHSKSSGHMRIQSEIIAHIRTASALPSASEAQCSKAFRFREVSPHDSRPCRGFAPEPRWGSVPDPHYGLALPRLPCAPFPRPPSGSNLAPALLSMHSDTLWLRLQIALNGKGIAFCDTRKVVLFLQKD